MRKVFFYISLSVLALNFVGVFLIELSPSAWNMHHLVSYKYPVASIYVSLFIALFVFFYYLLLVGAGIRPAAEGSDRVHKIITPSDSATIQLIFLSVFIFLMALFFVFYLDGIDVLRGDLGRGVYRRIDFGLGPIPTVLRSYIAPLAFFLLCIVFFSSNIKKYIFPIFLFGFISSVVLALSNGFKASVIWLVIPTVTFYFHARKKPFKKSSMVVFGFAMLTLVVFSKIILGGEGLVLSLLAILERVSVRTAVALVGIAHNVPLTGEPIEWSKTLSYFLGGTFVKTFLASTEAEIVDYSFSWKITALSGYSIDSISDGGHTMTSTIVGGGIYSGGVFGVIIFSMVFSIIIFCLDFYAEKLAVKGKFFSLFFLSFYFWLAPFRFLNGGDVTKLFNMNDFFFFVFAVFLALVYRSSLWKLRFR